jgi:hypothetical protein
MFVLINRIKDDSVEIKAEFILLVSNIEYHDCKWTKHIDSLIQRTSNQLNVLRKLKFILKREYLENIYFTFIRPILEYSSEVWDNCGQVNLKITEVRGLTLGEYQFEII